MGESEVAQGAAQGADTRPAEPVEQPHIPKILHLIWVGPHRPPQEMIDTWAEKHKGEKGWFFVLWREHKPKDPKDHFINQAQIDGRALRREWNGVADVMRYEILYRHGGFAVDADSICEKALDEGPEDFIHNATAVACYENESVRPGMIGCGFLGATKQHPFFKACIEDAGTHDVGLQAWKAVGPLLMGRVAQKMPDQIRVYPAIHFNPVHYTGAKAPGTGAIYADQKWGGTKGYNGLRKLPCSCNECFNPLLR